MSMQYCWPPDLFEMNCTIAGWPHLCLAVLAIPLGLAADHNRYTCC